LRSIVLPNPVDFEGCIRMAAFRKLS